jgi:hypothetical protein
MNNQTNSIAELQEAVYDLTSKLKYRDDMAVYGAWVLYFAKNVLVHELRPKIRSVGRAKITWPVVRQYIDRGDIEHGVSVILKSYSLDMHLFYDAIRFVEIYCPHATDANLHITHPPPAVLNVDAMYTVPLQLVMAAVLEAVATSQL